MWWVVGGAFVFLALVLYVPFLSQFFRFSRLSAYDGLFCVVAGLASVAWFEVPKLIMRRSETPPVLSKEELPGEAR